LDEGSEPGGSGGIEGVNEGDSAGCGNGKRDGEKGWEMHGAWGNE